MAKNNSKSIRISDETLKYIENYKGDGFNSKFENIILYAMKTENERKKRLEDIEKEILKKQTELSEIKNQINDLKNLSCDIKMIINKLTNLNDSTNVYLKEYENDQVKDNLQMIE